jgi:hypothetical protein
VGKTVILLSEEARLINDTVLEGIVVRDPWKYTEDLFFRLVSYRDGDLPPKKLDLERDAGDYINVRLNGGANGLIQIRKGMRLRVHGFLQSRDFRESLEEIVTKVRKNRQYADLIVEVKGELRPDRVLVDRNMVELVARRIIVLDTSQSNGRKGRISSRETIPAESSPIEAEFEPVDEVA